jgi:hypothetical protein
MPVARRCLTYIRCRVATGRACSVGGRSSTCSRLRRYPKLIVHDSKIRGHNPTVHIGLACPRLYLSQCHHFCVGSGSVVFAVVANPPLDLVWFVAFRTKPSDPSVRIGVSHSRFQSLGRSPPAQRLRSNLLNHAAIALMVSSALFGSMPVTLHPNLMTVNTLTI